MASGERERERKKIKSLSSLHQIPICTDRSISIHFTFHTVHNVLIKSMHGDDEKNGKKTIHEYRDSESMDD